MGANPPGLVQFLAQAGHLLLRTFHLLLQETVLLTQSVLGLVILVQLLLEALKVLLQLIQVLLICQNLLLMLVNLTFDPTEVLRGSYQLNVAPLPAELLNPHLELSRTNSLAFLGTSS